MFSCHCHVSVIVCVMYFISFNITVNGLSSIVIVTAMLVIVTIIIAVISLFAVAAIMIVLLRLCGGGVVRRFRGLLLPLGREPRHDGQGT